MGWMKAKERMTDHDIRATQDEWDRFVLDILRESVHSFKDGKIE